MRIVFWPTILYEYHDTISSIILSDLIIIWKHYLVSAAFLSCPFNWRETAEWVVLTKPQKKSFFFSGPATKALVATKQIPEFFVKASKKSYFS